jgi:hypothetical protein
MFHVYRNNALAIEDEDDPDERYVPSTLFQVHGTEQVGNATEKNTSFHQAPINRELQYFLLLIE